MHVYIVFHGKWNNISRPFKIANDGKFRVYNYDSEMKRRVPLVACRKRGRAARIAYTHTHHCGERRAARDDGSASRKNHAPTSPARIKAHYNYFARKIALQWQHKVMQCI